MLSKEHSIEGEITHINKLVTTEEIVLGYQIIIETDDMPKLTMGKCEVIQK